MAAVVGIAHFTLGPLCKSQFRYGRNKGIPLDLAQMTKGESNPVCFLGQLVRALQLAPSAQNRIWGEKRGQSILYLWGQSRR
ncbi:MAG: hypothetical protein RJP95_00880 [Pirellulales bacterium]